MNEEAERERIKQMREMVEHNQDSLNAIRKMLSRLGSRVAPEVGQSENNEKNQSSRSSR